MREKVGMLIKICKWMKKRVIGFFFSECSYVTFISGFTCFIIFQSRIFFCKAVRLCVRMGMWWAYVRITILINSNLYPDCILVVPTVRWNYRLPHTWAQHPAKADILLLFSGQTVPDFSFFLSLLLSFILSSLFLVLSIRCLLLIYFYCWLVLIISQLYAWLNFKGWCDLETIFISTEKGWCQYFPRYFTFELSKSVPLASKIIYNLKKKV